MNKIVTDEDVFELTNKAYDRGAADVLKIELAVLDQIEASIGEVDEPNATKIKYGVEFFRMVIEQIRLKLNEVVLEEPKPEDTGSKIVIPDGILSV